MKTVAVLSGGGAKCAFQAGVLDQLSRKGIVLSTLYGTSGGALNSAIFAYNGPETLKKLWFLTTSYKDVANVRWLTWPFRAGLCTLEPTRRVIDKYVGGNAKAEVVVAVSDLSTGLTRYVSNREVGPEDFRLSLIASSSVPGLVEPQLGCLVDGGVKEQTPLSEAVHAGADVIYVILPYPLSLGVHPWKNSPGPFKAFKTLVRSFEVLIQQFFAHDVETCYFTNMMPGARKIELHVYAPERTYGGFADFSNEAVRQAYNAGVDATEINLDAFFSQKTC